MNVPQNVTNYKQKLISAKTMEYIVRCPFLLARMIKVTGDGRVIYRTGKSKCLRFPEQDDERLKAGTSRNFQVFESVDFWAEVTQHIPEKGQHQILYFGFTCCAHKDGVESETPGGTRELTTKQEFVPEKKHKGLDFSLIGGRHRLWFC